MGKSNLAPLIDEYGALVTRMNKDIKKYKELRKELLPHGDVTKVLKGSKYCLTYLITNQERIDVKSVRAAMPQQWLNKFLTKIKKQTFKVTKL